MHLLVVSHKECWPSPESPSGYATDGGFAMQMSVLSELFDSTTLALPVAVPAGREGEIPLAGRGLSVAPLGRVPGRGAARKLSMPFWLARNAARIDRYVRAADAVHAAVPGDVGTVGMLAGWLTRKPLFVRHCGNWLEQTTFAEHLWRFAMERLAGGQNVMLATGGAEGPPSRRNASVRWIFATSLTEAELGAIQAGRAPLEAPSPRLLIASRQTAGKGTGALINSLPLVRDRFPDATLDVAGEGPDLAGFREQAARLGLAGAVTFHGRLDHEGVLSLMRRAGLFCLPSSCEGFPKAVLEALAHGVPVVASKVSVLPHLLGTGCGVVIDEVSPEAIARAVGACLSDPRSYRAMSARALDVSRRYSLERWRDEIAGRLSAAWGPLSADG